MWPEAACLWQDGSKAAGVTVQMKMKGCTAASRLTVLACLAEFR